MSEEPIYKNLYDQVMQIWVLPEIERRQKEGTLPKPIELRAVQVLFSIGGTSKVRINGEVQGKFEAKLKVPKEKGDLIYENEIEFAQVRELLEEDANFAHITMIRVGEQWSISFSFLYDTKEAEATLAIGKEFLDSGKSDTAEGRERAAINTLCIASEQIARATLNLHPLEGGHRKGKRHDSITRSVHLYSHIADVIPSEFAKAHKELVAMRDKARYDPSFKPPHKRLLEIGAEIEKLYNSTLSLVTLHATPGS